MEDNNKNNQNQFQMGINPEVRNLLKPCAHYPFQFGLYPRFCLRTPRNATAANKESCHYGA